MVPRDLAAQDTLRVGISLYSPPSTFYDPRDDELVGADVEIARALGTVMDLPNVEFVPVPFSRILSLLGEDYDVAISIISVTSGRLETANFVTYAETGSIYLTKINNPHKFDPDQPCGSRILVQEQTVQEEQLEVMSAQCVAADEDAITIVTAKTIDDEITELREDAAAAAYSDSIVADSVAAEKNSRLVTTGKLTFRGPIGVAVSNANSQLTVAVQAAMQFLMEEGFVAQALDRYGVGEAALNTAVINPRVD